MAKLVTPDGKKLNIFLNLDDSDDGNGANPLKYGSKNHSGMNFVVSAFRNFKMNYNTCDKLVLHNSSGEMELDIASLISTNPSISSKMTVVSGTTVYFVEDDLLLETTSGKITRIDIYESLPDIITQLNDRIAVLEAQPQGRGINLLSYSRQPSVSPTAHKFNYFEYGVNNDGYTLPSSPSSSDYKVSVDLSEVPSDAIALIVHCNFRAVANNNSGTYIIATSSSANAGQTWGDVTDEIWYYHATFAYDWQQDIAYNGTIFLKKDDKLIANSGISLTISGYLK